jgi:hypothetical protein
MRADGTGSLRERSKKGLIFVSRETGVTLSIAVSSFKFLLISYSRREEPSPPKSKPCFGAMNARGNNSGCSKGSRSKFPRARDIKAEAPTSFLAPPPSYCDDLTRATCDDSGQLSFLHCLSLGLMHYAFGGCRETTRRGRSKLQTAAMASLRVDRASAPIAAFCCGGRKERSWSMKTRARRARNGQSSWSLSRTCSSG